MAASVGVSTAPAVAVIVTIAPGAVSLAAIVAVASAGGVDSVAAPQALIAGSNNAQPAMSVSALTFTLFIRVLQSRFSVVHGHASTTRRPAEEPRGRGEADVDAPVRHGMAEVIVPVRPMYPVPPVKVHDVGHVRQIVVVAPYAARHACGRELGINVEGARYGGILGDAGTDAGGIDGPNALIRHQRLCAQVHIYPARPCGDYRSSLLRLARAHPGA